MKLVKLCVVGDSAQCLEILIQWIGFTPQKGFHHFLNDAAWKGHLDTVEASFAPRRPHSTN